MPQLIIDHRSIDVPVGTKVITAAEQLGIEIPRFCYHPALGPVGACRVCAVSFLDGPVKGVQMSCMVNAQDGMVVSTTDDHAVDFRRQVIEWLMLNHPHDCPVCDEGGHCLLQDLTVAGGHGLRRYRGLKRTHNDQYLGPLVQHEMNRCIQCYRCARYYQEIAGGRDLGVLGIGQRVYFGRTRPGRLESPFSGNLIDLCPTGVYTDKPSRFLGRRWEFERAPSICVHCSLGCNITVSARYRRIVRHEARPNSDVNGYLICDRGRYGYSYNDSPQRPRQALVDGEVRPVAEALSAARHGLDAVIDRYGPQAVAVIGSLRSSLETLGTLTSLCGSQKWRGPVVAQQPHAARNLKAAADCLSNDLAASLNDVSSAEAVVVIGADPINEAPLLALSLRKVALQGGRVTVIDPREVALPLEFDHIAVTPSQLGPAIQFLIHGSGNFETLLSGQLSRVANRLAQCQRVVVVCGTDITTDQEIILAATLTKTLQKTATDARLFYLLGGPNAMAAARLGAVDTSIETVLDQIDSGSIKAVLVVENDLWRHFPDRERLNRTLERLEQFVYIDYVDSPFLAKTTVFLPSQTLYESGGRWINQEGRLQPAEPVVAGGFSIEVTGQGDHPPRTFEQTIPGSGPEAAWKLVTAIENGVSETVADEPPQAVTEAIATVVGKTADGGRIVLLDPADFEPKTMTSLENGNDPVTILLVDQTFGTEGLSRESAALAEITPKALALIHPKTARALGLTGDGSVAIATKTGKIVLEWCAKEKMAKGVVVIPRHHRLDWQVLGETRFKLNNAATISEVDEK